MATGWLRVQAQQPVRAAFWLVNRARVVAAPIPLFADIPPLPHRLAGGEKLWVLNPGTTPVRARINGREEFIDGGALQTFGAQERNEIDARAPLISFTSTKTRDGNTSFLWPRGIE
jgi:hypothetical protein